MTLQQTQKKFQQLQQNLSGANPDLNACGAILNELKIFLLDLSFLPSTGQSVGKEEATLARQILEQGCFWGIKKGDIASFDRFYAQLKHYYFDLNTDGEQLQYRNELIGAYLLSLLSQNRNSEFHIELEVLDPSLVHSHNKNNDTTDSFLRYPVLLEQYLIEGSTNKFFKACLEESPSDSYKFFTNILVQTVRGDIADCVEKSFISLPLSDAKRVLFISDDNTLQALAAEKKWTVGEQNGVKCYNFEKEPPKVEVIPSKSLIKKSLAYAKEMERIV